MEKNQTSRSEGHHSRIRHTACHLFSRQQGELPSSDVDWTILVDGGHSDFERGQQGQDGEATHRRVPLRTSFSLA